VLTLVSGNASHYRFLRCARVNTVDFRVSLTVRDVCLSTRLSAYYEYWSSKWLRLSVRL